MSFVNGRRIAYLLTGVYLLRRFLRHFLKSDTPNQQTIRSGLSSDELRQFLPTFLSQGSQKAFIDEIKYFLTFNPSLSTLPLWLIQPYCSKATDLTDCRSSTCQTRQSKPDPLCCYRIPVTWIHQTDGCSTVL